MTQEAPPARPSLVCLHCLGGSARGWEPLLARLAHRFDGLAIDLPGFGDAGAATGYSVAEMAEHAAARVRAAAPKRWLLAGHSMGAKVATALARRAEDGEAGLAGLVGIVLLAGSPPAPEPMDAARRQEMLGWCDGTAEQRRAQAETFVAANLGAALAPAPHRRATEDVLRAAPAAWRAWLTGGSREDWSARIGVLHTPTLIVAGGADRDLGAEAQLRLVLPHFSRARVETLDGAGHLLPMERPEALAALIAAHADGAAAEPGPAYRALIHSGRVSRRTRDALLGRLAPEAAASVLHPGQLATLRALLARVLPQPAAGEIDLAARIDARLAAGAGDGWRFDVLPPDASAYRAGLATLAGAGFEAMDAAAQEALLARAMAGDLAAAPLDTARLALWLADVRADAVRAWLPHPATLARLGYSGIGYGGDRDAPGERLPGFVRLEPGEREAWEPERLP